MFVGKCCEGAYRARLCQDLKSGLFSRGWMRFFDPTKCRPCFGIPHNIPCYYASLLMHLQILPVFTNPNNIHYNHSFLFFSSLSTVSILLYFYRELAIKVLLLSYMPIYVIFSTLDHSHRHQGAVHAYCTAKVLHEIGIIRRNEAYFITLYKPKFTHAEIFY